MTQNVMQKVSTPSSIGQLRAMDGYRGVLALCVAIYHTAWPSYINETAFFEQGTVLVDLFFVFSGFLMYGIYRDRIQTWDQGATFMKRRFARLYPIHLFMLLLMALFAAVRLVAHDYGLASTQVGEILPFHDGARETWYSFFVNIFMLQATGLTDSLTFNYPSWTISGDLFAYSLFAILMVIAPPKKFTSFLPLLIIMTGIYAFLATQKANMDITYDYGAIRVIAGFIAGMFGAFIFTKIKSHNGHEKFLNNRIFINILEVFALMAFILFVIYMPGKLQFFVAPFAFIFVVVFSFNAGLISKFMSNKLFAYFAKISYSVYMVHIVVAIVMGLAADSFIVPALLDSGTMPTLLGDLYLIPYLLLVIAFSHLTYHLIEVPGGKIMSKIQIRGSIKYLTRKLLPALAK